MNAPAADKDVSAQVLRALAMLEVLSGELPNGLSNKDIATALNCPPPYVTRTAATLIDKGWVERTPEGRFRITTRFGQLSVRSLRAFEKCAQQLDDMKRNYLLG
jgi:DNA-binding IclR family transcriptional regulator